MKHNTESKKNFKDMAEAAGALGGTKFLLSVFTQPLHNVKNHRQLLDVAGQRFTVMQSLRTLLQQPQPVRAIYKSGFSGGLKEFGKNGVKGFYMKGIPDYLRTHFPVLCTGQYPVTYALVCGTLAGLAENVTIGWFERYITFLSTSQLDLANASYRKTLGAISGVPDKIRFIYQGFVPATLKSSLALSIYFGVDGPVKCMTTSLYGVSSGPHRPWYVSGTDAMLVALMVALTTTPVDVLKTQAQKAVDIKKYPEKKGVRPLGFFQSVQHNYAQNGVSGFYAGFLLKVSLSFIGWFATRIVLEEFVNKNPSSQSPSIKGPSSSI